MNLMISVVVPAHNRPALLLEAARSVAAQSYENFELVVIDDGSTPPLDPVGLESVVGERLRFHRHDTAQGISRSKNHGVSLAQGEVVLLLDDDDILKPDALAVIARSYSRHPQLDCVFMGVEPFGQWAEGPARNRERTLRRLIELTRPAEVDGLFVFEREKLFEALLGRVPIDFQRPAARRATWEKVGGFDEKALFAESSWAMLVSLDCRIALTVEPITGWRIHDNNFGWPAGLSEWEILSRNGENEIYAGEGLYAAVLAHPGATAAERRIVARYLAAAYLSRAQHLRERHFWKGFVSCLLGVRKNPSVTTLKALLMYPVSRKVRDRIKRALGIRPDPG